MAKQNPRRANSADSGNLSRSDYFAAGMAILAEQGPRKLTTTNICARIGATRGSFYHHFASGPAFISALISHWEADVYARADEAVSGTQDPVAAFKAAGISAQHRAERAIRGWAYEDARVAAAQRRVDEFRRARLVEIFTRQGIGSAQIATLADLGVALYAGVQVVDGFDRARRTAVVDVYDDLVRASGTAPRDLPD